MRTFLLSLLFCGSPVPRHLFPPEPPDPVRVGYRWWYHTWELQVVRVEGETVYYRCLNWPEKVFGGCEASGLSRQSKKTTRDESATHYQYPAVGLPDWIYER